MYLCYALSQGAYQGSWKNGGTLPKRGLNEKYDKFTCMNIKAGTCLPSPPPTPPDMPLHVLLYNSIKHALPLRNMGNISFKLSVSITMATKCNNFLHLRHRANPCVNTRVKISQNVDILAKVSRALNNNRILSNLMCSTKYIYRSKWVDHFWLVKALSCIVHGVKMTVETSQKCLCLCAHLGQQSKQAVGWFWPL